MRSARPLSTVWAESGPSAVALSAALLVAERVGAVALAWALLGGGGAVGLALGAGLACLFAARAVVRGAQRSNAQERLHQATARALLAGDMLRASPLDDEDAQGAVLEGAVVGSRFVSEIVPDFIGDALVALVTLGAFAATQPVRVVAAAVAALAAATAAAFLARRLVRRAEERAWRLHGPVVDDLVATLAGRLELVANGREEGFLGEVRDRL